MTHDVATVTRETSYKDIERLLAERHISGVVVVDERRRPIGVVSEADLLLKRELGSTRDGAPWVFAGHRARIKASATTAGELMSSPALTMEATAPLALAARELRRHGINRLPVVAEGRLAGVVSRADVLKGYLRPDSDIEHDILEGVIHRMMWIDPSSIDVQVEDGVVSMRGQLERFSEIDMLVDLVRGVEGVVSVEHELSYRFDDRHVRPSTELRIS